MLFFIIMNLIFCDCVNKDTVRLKAKPETNAKILWQVRKYFPLRVIRIKNDWAKVKDFRGDTYWIEKEHITSEYKCLIVKYKEMNIRTGPGTNFKKKYKETAKLFDCFKLKQRKRGWVEYIDPYLDTGWISEKGVWVF